MLAGANTPEAAGPDGGILTGEAIVTLPLEGLELAVLSACATGLGDVAAGECVHNLQHAFHVAGCRNVVASLWNVNDRATAALMATFYDELLTKKRPPLEALREAQLYVYRHPGEVPQPAERAAPILGQAVPAPAAPTAGARPQGARSDVKDWAAFVLSGAGR